MGTNQMDDTSHRVHKSQLHLLEIIYNHVNADNMDTKIPIRVPLLPDFYFNCNTSNCMVIVLKILVLKYSNTLPISAQVIPPPVVMLRGFHSL